MKPDQGVHTETRDILDRIFTPLDEAIAEIKRRRKDSGLVERVKTFLGSIPEHFDQKDPILYLSRHVATPNLETLRFIELAKPYGLPTVIGEDHDDKFVSNNSLKRSLGKMPVMKGTARNGDEIIENFTIIDFDKAQGKPLHAVDTIFDEKLTSFHAELMREIYPSGVQIIDESAWVGKCRKKELLTQYKRMFALHVVHGISFEWYPPQEAQLVKDIVIPAIDFIHETFGVMPLIHELVPAHLNTEKNWESYPSVLYPFLRRKIERKHLYAENVCINQSTVSDVVH